MSDRILEIEEHDGVIYTVVEVIKNKDYRIECDGAGQGNYTSHCSAWLAMSKLIKKNEKVAHV